MPNIDFLWYMGGKFKIADWIVSFFPKHRTYVEVFGGGASVLFRKPRSLVEVYNDVWDDLVNLFLVLRDKPKELQGWLRYTPVSRSLYEKYLKKFKNRDFQNEIERAGVTFFLLRSSRNANITDGWHLGPARSHARDIKIVTDRLLEFAERFRGVIIENMDFRKCIKKYDSEETLFYCDPPYMGLKHYLFSFDYRDHYELAKLLKTIEGKAVISYYENEEVKNLYPEGEWRYKSKIVAKSSADAKGGLRPRAKELLIMNYNPPKSPIKPKIRLISEVFT